MLVVWKEITDTFEKTKKIALGKKPTNITG